MTPNDVVMLISIQAFQVIDLIFAIKFSIWACTFMKKKRNLFMNQNLFSKKVEKTFKILMNDLFCFVLFCSINFLNLKTSHFFYQSLTCDSTSMEVIHQEKSIKVIGLIVQNILTKIKLYSGIKATWQLSYTWFIF